MPPYPTLSGVRPSLPSQAGIPEHEFPEEDRLLTDTTYAPLVPETLPLRDSLPRAIFAVLILMLAIYFVGAEEGAASVFDRTMIHEFVHDGRHLLGFPCH